MKQSSLYISWKMVEDTTGIDSYILTLYNDDKKMEDRSLEPTETSVAFSNENINTAYACVKVKVNDDVISEDICSNIVTVSQGNIVTIFNVTFFLVSQFYKIILSHFHKVTLSQGNKLTFSDLQGNIITV